MSGGFAAAANGLGLVGGSLSVHMDGEPERLPVFRQAIATGRLPGGFAADDGAALLMRGTELERCVSSRAGARVVAVQADGDGGSVERELPVTPLAGALPAPGTTSPPDVASATADEAFGVSELRALRGGRHRWH
jgi:dipeptidase E